MSKGCQNCVHFETYLDKYNFCSVGYCALFRENLDVEDVMDNGSAHYAPLTIDCFEEAW